MHRAVHPQALRSLLCWARGSLPPAPECSTRKAAAALLGAQGSLLGAGLKGRLGTRSPRLLPAPPHFHVTPCVCRLHQFGPFV